MVFIKTMKKPFKKTFMTLLKYLNTKPVFRRLFFHIHSIREDDFKTKSFIAVKTQGFLLGQYGYDKKSLWRRIAENNFEPTETEFIKDNINNYDIFIDIGAHIGYYSCLVNRLNSKIQIYSFEPSKTNFINLQENLKMNSIKSPAYNIALSNEKKEVPLYDKDSMGSIVSETFGNKPEEMEIVQTNTLDNIFDREILKGKRILIKIDAEGSEFNILKGARNFIERYHPVFMIEICRTWSGGQNPNFEETFRFMDKYKYKYSMMEEGEYLFK